ncbi:MAG: hypothetical protein IJ383_08770 [Bacteroidales bacterium]|nr:hypothetical protein [Bacteroidales bacterium]
MEGQLQELRHKLPDEGECPPGRREPPSAQVQATKKPERCVRSGYMRSGYMHGVGKKVEIQGLRR